MRQIKKFEKIGRLRPKEGQGMFLKLSDSSRILHKNNYLQLMRKAYVFLFATKTNHMLSIPTQC
jgi:hypothetical protein